MKSCITAILTSLVLIASGRAAAVIDFSSASDLSRFNLVGETGTYFSYSATMGVGGSGGIVSSAPVGLVNSSHNFMAAAYPIGLAITEPYRFVQVDFKMPTTNSLVGIGIRLGFLASPAMSFNQLMSGGPQYAMTQIFQNEEERALAIMGRLSSPLPELLAVSANWQRLKVEITRQSSGNYRVFATLYDLGENGLAEPTPFFNTFLDMPIADPGATLYPGFYIGDGVALDNFTSTSVVPEPSVWGLLSAACVAGFVWLGRKRFGLAEHG